MNIEYINKTQKEVWTLQRILTAFNTRINLISEDDKLIVEKLIKEKEHIIRMNYMQD